MSNQDDFYSPISERLRDMTRDLSNTVMSVLAVAASTRTLQQRKEGVNTELRESLDHLSKAFAQWKKLEEIIDFMSSHLDELDEITLAKLVEKAADSTMALQLVGLHGRLKEVRTAHLMISLDDDLIPYSVKEVGFHSKERLQKWKEEIDKFLAI